MATLLAPHHATQWRATSRNISGIGKDEMRRRKKTEMRGRKNQHFQTAKFR